MVNNPCGIGVHEARLLYGPEALMQATVVSVGTGQPLATPQRGTPSAGTSWRDKFNKVHTSPLCRVYVIPSNRLASYRVIYFMTRCLPDVISAIVGIAWNIHKHLFVDVLWHLGH